MSKQLFFLLCVPSVLSSPFPTLGGQAAAWRQLLVVNLSPLTVSWKNSLRSSYLQLLGTRSVLEFSIFPDYGIFAYT
jgi:hypothetical protein